MRRNPVLIEARLWGNGSAVIPSDPEFINYFKDLTSILTGKALKYVRELGPGD